MKKILVRLLLSLLCLTMLIPAYVSCKDNGDENQQPPVEMMTIIGGENQYVVVRPEKLTDEFQKAAAVAVNNALKAATGVNYKMTTDYKTNPVSDYEICIGNVSRNGEYYNVDTSTLADDEFIVKVEGTRIVIVGKTEYGTQMAAQWFIDTYLNVEAGSLSFLEIPKELNHVGKIVTGNLITVMTQNLLSGAAGKDYQNADYITVDYKQHTLEKRFPRFIKLLKQYQPDIVGLQECCAEWRSMMAGGALESAGYARVGATKHQKVSVLYNTNKLKLIETNSIWLSEDPENLSLTKEWGNPETEFLVERLAMYCVFEVIETGERFIHFNTHIEIPSNSIIQTKQTEVLVSYVDEIRAKFDNIPAVVTGDFNYNYKSEPFKVLLSTCLKNTKTESTFSSGAGSFNKFIGKTHHAEAIDQILATDNFDFRRYRVLYDTFDGNYVSDHYAVLAELAFK